MNLWDYEDEQTYKLTNQQLIANRAQEINAQYAPPPDPIATPNPLDQFGEYGAQLTDYVPTDYEPPVPTPERTMAGGLEGTDTYNPMPTTSFGETIERITEPAGRYASEGAGAFYGPMIRGFAEEGFSGLRPDLNYIVNPPDSQQLLQDWGPGTPEPFPGFKGALEMTVPDPADLLLGGTFAGDIAGGLARMGGRGARAISREAPIVARELAGEAGTFGRQGDDIVENTASAVNPTTKQPWEMAPDELEASYRSTLAIENGIEESLFGKDGAARYKQLQRTANSAMDPKRADAASAEIDRMEALLSEQQRNALYGIDQETPTAEDYKAYLTAIRRVDTSSPKEMGDSLKWALTKVGQETDPTLMTPPEREAFAQIKYAYDVAQRNGWDINEISNTALAGAIGRYSNADDAEFMLKRYIRGAQEPPKPQPPMETLPELRVKPPALIDEPPRVLEGELVDPPPPPPSGIKPPEPPINGPQGINVPPLPVNPTVKMMPLEQVIKEQSKPGRQLTSAHFKDDLAQVGDAVKRQSQQIRSLSQFPESLAQTVKNPFKVKDGVISEGGARGVVLHDMMEWGDENIARLNPNEQTYVRNMRQIVNDWADWAKSQGIDLPDKAGEYWPRFVESVRGTESKAAPRRTLGAKQSPQFQRFYEYAFDGKEAGVDYMDNVPKTLGLYARTLMKMVQDEQIYKYFEKFAKSDAGPLSFPEGQVRAHPNFEKLIFPEKVAFGGKEYSGREFATKITEMLQPEQTNWLTKGAGWLASPFEAQRWINTIGDLGNFLIQGFGTLVSDPKRYPEMVGRSVLSFADETQAAKFAMQNSNAFRAYLEAGGPWKRTEYTDTPLLSALERIPVLGKIPTGFDRTFRTMTDISALMNFQAFYAYKQAGKQAPTELADLAAKMTGRRGMFGPVISESQNLFERTLISYAPSFRRATLSLVGDAVKPGVEGDLARYALGRIAAGSMLLTLGAAGIADATSGQFRFSDPRSKDFVLNPDGPFWGRVMGAGDDVRTGLSNVWMGTFRLMGRMATAAGRQNPQGALDALSAFVTNQAAPAVSQAMTQFKGVSRTGEKLDDPVKRVQEFARQFQPIWAQAGEQGGPVSGAKEFFGISTAPLTPNQKRSEVSRQVSGGKAYEDLGVVDRLKVNASPDVLKSLGEPRLTTYEEYQRFSGVAEQTKNDFMKLPAVEGLRITFGEVGDTINKMPLSVDERISYQKEAYRNAIVAVNKVTSNPKFKDMEPIKQKKLLYGAIADAREKAAGKIMSRIPVEERRNRRDASRGAENASLAAATR